MLEAFHLSMAALKLVFYFLDFRLNIWIFRWIRGEGRIRMEVLLTSVP